MKGTRELADFSYLGDPGLKLPKPMWSAPSERCQDGCSRCRAVRRLLIVPLVSAVVLCSIKAPAAIDPKIHKLCAKTTDYVGCVKMNSSPTSVQPENTASDLEKIS